MEKNYTALGLMSGTSMDGVDVSIIESNGIDQFTNIFDEYCEFDDNLHKKLTHLRNVIFSKSDLENFSKEIIVLEKEITLFHAKIIDNIPLKYKEKIDLIGFHGQTIFHNPKDKITKQLGNGKLLSQLSKKIVVFNFREKDLENNGQGAPLTPIFHNLLSNDIYNKKNELPNILNVGGISNVTMTVHNKDLNKKKFEAFDIGPGNCLIDEWIRKNSNKRFDKNGLIAKSGKINELILNQAIENFGEISFDKSLDIKDFDISFARGLSLEDGCATITNFTAYLISEGIKFSYKRDMTNSKKYLICGGGRKNNFLVDNIKNYLDNFEDINLEAIDLYDCKGDYIESQAFGFLAIRSYLGLPITFPNTTRCKEPTTGGMIVKNF